MESETQAVGPIGVTGSYGPNDNGYLCVGIRSAAKILKSCSELWSEGHYPHSNAKVMPENHPLAIALKELSKIDVEICEFANKTHDPELFKIYIPSLENQTRWNNDWAIGKSNTK